MPKSPTEAGELTPSPKLEDDRMEVDDSLNIKPPQTHAKKERHKHKHKHKEHKRDRHKRSKDKVDVTGDGIQEKSRERTTSNLSERDDRRDRKRDRQHREDRLRDDRLTRDQRPWDDRLTSRVPARDDRNKSRDGGYGRLEHRGDVRSLDRAGQSRDLRENLDRVRSARDDRLREDRRYSPSVRDQATLQKDDRKQPSPYDRRTGDEVSRRRGEKRDDSRRRSRSPVNRKKDFVEQNRSETSEGKGKKSDSKGEGSSMGKLKSDLKSDDMANEVVEVESSDEEESGSEEEDEEESGEEEQGDSSSGEEESGEEESGSEEEDSEEEEAESGEEEEGEEVESSSSADQSEEESEHEKVKSKKKRKKNKKKKAVKNGDKSKFESESESEGAEEETIEQADDHNGTADAEGSEVEMAASPELSDPPTPPPQLPLYYPALQGCRSVDDFRHLNRIEEGTYGVVFRAEDLKMKEIVALKRLKMEKEKEGFPITSLREINTLLKTQHENIVTVREIVVGSNMDKIYLVMDFVEHDLKALMETMKSPFAIGEVKTLLIQLLKAVAHMHDNWILHRDLKTSNLLLSHKGILKVGDFGLAREYGSPLKPYTPVVVTLWYRAPELLLGCKQYNTAIDVWSVGCIFAELLLMKALWPGKNEIDQLNKIFKDMGTPNEKIWPGVSELPAMKKCNFADYPYNTLKNRFAAGLVDDNGYELLNKFLTYDPTRRITAEEAKRHKYFDTHPLPIDPSMFPTWPARSEQPRGKRDKTPKPPSGGAAYKLMAADDARFHLGANNPAGGFNLRF